MVKWKFSHQSANPLAFVSAARATVLVTPATLFTVCVSAVSFVTLAIAFLLWRSVLAHGTILYVMGGESFSLTLPSGFTFPVRIMFEIDALSAFMGLTVGIASFAGALFSLQYMRGFSGLHRFVSLYFLLTVGAMGMSLTGDMFNFFVFIEIASVASFGLIAFWRDKPEAIEASFKYMLLSQISAMLILIAVGSIYGKYNFLNMAAIANAVQMSTLDKLILALLVAALAMKCGAFPMSMWMPDSYAESPSGVTCLLVTVSQVSLYGLMRVCFTLFGTVAQSGFIPWIFIVLGLMSMFFGVTMAVIQHEIKRLIGYHSISQVGYMLLAFGVGLAALHDPRALADYGFTAIKGGRSAAESAAQVRAVLAGEPGAKLDMVLLNAGTALMAAGKAETIPAGIALAREIIASGAALDKLEQLVRFSRS